MVKEASLKKWRRSGTKVARVLANMGKDKADSTTASTAGQSQPGFCQTKGRD
jgi:hypothetical protein